MACCCLPGLNFIGLPGLSGMVLWRQCERNNEFEGIVCSSSDSDPSIFTSATSATSATGATMSTLNLEESSEWLESWDVNPLALQVIHPGEEIAQFRRARECHNASFDPFVSVYDQQIRAMLDAIDCQKTKKDTFLGRNFWPYWGRCIDWPRYRLLSKILSGSYQWPRTHKWRGSIVSGFITWSFIDTWTGCLVPSTKTYGTWHCRMLIHIQCWRTLDSNSRHFCLVCGLYYCFNDGPWPSSSQDIRSEFQVDGGGPNSEDFAADAKPPKAHCGIACVIDGHDEQGQLVYSIHVGLPNMFIIFLLQSQSVACCCRSSVTRCQSQSVTSCTLPLHTWTIHVTSISIAEPCQNVSDF